MERSDGREHRGDFFLLPRRRGWMQPAPAVRVGSVSSRLTGVMYPRALEDFFAWSTGEGRPPFTRVTVQGLRARLEAKCLAPASVNQKLSAVRWSSNAALAARPHGRSQSRARSAVSLF